MKEKISKLYSKDDKETYKLLLDLELISSESDELYPYFDEFLEMLNSERSFVRVRGFRLICSLAKWDKDNKINKNIDSILDELDDSISTSVRQCLGKLNLILLYKNELSLKVESKLKHLNISSYKETMQSLIKRDIANILKGI